MGTYLYLAISKSVTKEEWEKVYPETLHLMKKFHLAEQREVKIHGIDVTCLVPSEEHVFTYGWCGEKKKVGWMTGGDYKTLGYAEDFFIPRDLTEGTEWEPDAGDAMMGALAGYLNNNWDDPRFNHAYHLWGYKTQGEPYHRLLLAIACLIATRLGDKVFVYGDISNYLCKEAVKLANQYAEHPVEMPSQCHRERFMQRVQELPIPDEDKSRIFKAFYLEEKDCAGLFVHSFDGEPINHEINWPSMLKYYEKGDKVDPHMAQALGKSRQFLDTTLKEEEFSTLMKADAQYRCEWLIKHNHYMMLRDKDWEKIFTDIEQHPESFGRYYPVCRVRMESMSLVEMGMALLINDALYEYSGELAAKESEE